MHKKADEVRSELVEKLGEEFGPVLHDLEQEYIMIKLVWRFYRSFFGTNPERIQLLNDVSGLYFYTLEHIKFEAVLLGICRVTDSIETGRGERAKQNLTLRRFGNFLKPEHKEEWETLLQDVEDKVSFAKSWRNQKIAHSSFDVKNGKAHLEGASREKVENAFASIERALNFIHREYLNNEKSYYPLPRSRDEVRVLELIYDGLDAEAKNQSRAPKPDWLTKRP